MRRSCHSNVVTLKLVTYTALSQEALFFSDPQLHREVVSVSVACGDGTHILRLGWKSPLAETLERSAIGNRANVNSELEEVMTF